MENIWSRSSPSSIWKVYSRLMQEIDKVKDRNCNVHIHTNEQAANIEYWHCRENACSEMLHMVNTCSIIYMYVKRGLMWGHDEKARSTGDLVI